MEKLLEMLFGFLDMLSPALASSIRDAIAQAIRDWRESAKETPTPWDDKFVEIVAGILGIELGG